MIFLISTCFLLIFHTKSLWTYPCLKCATKVYQHFVTIENLPSSTDDDCNIVQAMYGCYIQLDWLGDGTSEVSYTINPDVPSESILAIVERQVILKSNEYSTRRSIGYSCRLNQMACNTIDDLKRAMISTKFPTERQIQQFDHLIAPMRMFNASLCSQFSNMINCPKSDLVRCRQCMSAVQYSRYLDICSTCSMENFTRNFFLYRTIISINLSSRSERIAMICQQKNACNSMENIQDIKRILTIELDAEKFSRSVASTIETASILLLTEIFTGWFLLK